MVPFQEICYRTVPVLTFEFLLKLHKPLHQTTMRLTRFRAYFATANQAVKPNRLAALWSANLADMV